MKIRLIALFLIISGCASVPPANEEGGVRAAMASYMDALNALDADRMTAAFAENATVFLPSGQPQRLNGRGEIGAALRAVVDQLKPKVSRLSLVPEDMTVETSGDLALVTFQIRGSMIARRTWVFRRVGGRWLIAHLHASEARAPS